MHRSHVARLGAVLLALLIAPWAWAETQDGEPQQSRVPAVIYLQFLNQQAPDLLCDNHRVAQCLDLKLGQCKSMVLAAAETCGPRLLDDWPKSFAETPENARRYSTEYRQCIHREWQRTGQVDALQLNLCQ